MKGASHRGRGKGRGGGTAPTAVGREGLKERSDHTFHFYSIDEVLSALQKAVRRGHARNAAFWAGELHVSGLTAIALKRLLIMTIEDVGLASPYAPFVAAAAAALSLTMPEEARDTLAVPPRLALVCALAWWVSGLPKTRTSCMLASFQRARAEECRRCMLASRAFRPLSIDEVGSALRALYSACVGELATFLQHPRRDDAAFLLAEEEVLVRAHLYQCCHKTEADGLRPVFEVIARLMLQEEQRLKAEATQLRDISSADDFLSGFATVRKMVLDLQQLSTGALDSAARMVLSQSLLLATRAHHLVLEGLIVLPSAAENCTERGLCRSDFCTHCPECMLMQLGGAALARRNTRLLAGYARDRSSAAAFGAPVALQLERIVRAEVLAAGQAALPRGLFESLRQPASEASGRYLHIPPYCVDIHTRRGSGFPMHREWDDCLVPHYPFLQEWPREERQKTHGELDIEGRRIASQFNKYGLVVSDEFFPGPALPEFEPFLKPDNFEQFVAEILPVAALDHGEHFVDRMHHPDGYGELSAGAALAHASTVVAQRRRSSETTSLLAESSGLPAGAGYCCCRRGDRYANPAAPLDPYFTAAKTFMSWAENSGFPRDRDFPGGRLPQLLERKATSTIRDDPNGKRQTQVEGLMEKTDSSGRGAFGVDAKRSAIDSRPSAVTELHRAHMQELMEQARVSGAAFGTAAIANLGGRREPGSHAAAAVLQDRRSSVDPPDAGAAAASTATSADAAPSPALVAEGGPQDVGWSAGSRKPHWGRR